MTCTHTTSSYWFLGGSTKGQPQPLKLMIHETLKQTSAQRGSGHAPVLRSVTLTPTQLASGT